MKKAAVLFVLIALVVSVGIGFLCATEKVNADEGIQRQVYNAHLIWDEIDKNYYCVGSAINCTKPKL